MEAKKREKIARMGMTVEEFETRQATEKARNNTYYDRCLFVQITDRRFLPIPYIFCYEARTPLTSLPTH
jgi:hypothetical protein